MNVGRGTNAGRVKTPHAKGKVAAKGLAKGGAKGKGKVDRRKKRDYSNFNTYIYKVLKQTHPEVGMSAASMGTMNEFALSMIMKISNNINVLKFVDKSQTISSRDVQDAVRLTLPGELAKHAVQEGTKAVTKYKVKEGKGLKAKRKEARSGLVFPVSRVESMMRQFCNARRVSDTAPVYFAGVLEYLVAEILELAGNAARDYKKVRISNKHIMLAVEGDEELHTLASRNHLLVPGGVVPHMDRRILPQKK